MADENGNTPSDDGYDPSTEDGSDGPAATDNSQQQPSAPLPADNAPAADTSGQGSDATSSSGSTQYFNGYNPSSGTFGDGSSPGNQASAPQAAPPPQPQSNPAQNRSAPQPAPSAAQTNISVGGVNYNTNSQSDRATLRSQGYYIDNSGIYAPGSGQRVGSTFSGSAASQNVAPSPTQLPIIGGIPVSPSNGETGPQTGAIMYRSDPDYAKYFGPGTPGYSSTTAAGARGNPLLGASGPEAGQGTLMQYDQANGINPELGLQADTSVPAPANMPTTMGPMIPGDTSATPQTTNAPAALSGASPTDQNNSWLTGIQQLNSSGYGYGPYSTQDTPQLTSAGAPYNQAGQLIQKSTDQYGNAYYQTVGTAPAQPAAAPAAPVAPAAAAASADAAAGRTQQVEVPDGKGGYATVMMTPQDKVAYLADATKQANAAQQVITFNQTETNRQFNLKQTIDTAHAAYETSIAQNASVAQAQKAANDAITNTLNQQTLALNQQKAASDTANQQATLAQNASRNAADALYQQGQLANTAQTNSLNAQKLAQDRQSARGRSLPMVRYS